MHVYFCCVCFSFSVLSQEIGWEERLQNDLFCVELDVKPQLSQISGRATVGRQAASADWLRDGIEGSGGGGQAKFAMSCQGRGLRGRTDGQIQAIPPQSGVTACSILKDVCPKINSKITLVHMSSF